MNTPTLQRAFFLLLLATASLAFVWIVSPFFGAIFWAVVLAMLFMPIHRRLCVKLNGRETLAAITTMLGGLVVVLVPVALVITAMVSEAMGFAQRIRSGEFNPTAQLQEIINALPAWAQRQLSRWDIVNIQDVLNHLTEALVRGSQAITQQALAIGQNTLMLVVNVGIMLYLLFFFLRDGRALASRIRSVLPMQPMHTDYLLHKFATVTRATVKGTVVVSFVQGALGGIAFAFLGVHGAVLWGVCMAFLSLVPAVGAALIWGPVAIYFLATGSTAAGLGLVAWGAGVMGMADNVLRPILVGKDTKLPDYLVLLTTIGGMSLLGLNGFVIGPVIGALFVATWALFSQREAALYTPDDDLPPALPGPAPASPHPPAVPAAERPPIAPAAPADAAPANAADTAPADAAPDVPPDVPSDVPPGMAEPTPPASAHTANSSSLHGQ